MKILLPPQLKVLSPWLVTVDLEVVQDAAVSSGDDVLPA
jgi:hypothetical protein